ncbi:unnamed protein product [Ascophyllum nodosum]
MAHLAVSSRCCLFRSYQYVVFSSTQQVQAFVEKQTVDIQAIYPALQDLLSARAKGELESAGGGSDQASTVTKSELPVLVQSILRELRDGGGTDCDDMARIQAVIDASRECTLRTVDAHLERAIGDQQQDMLAQEKRLVFEMEDNARHLSGRIEKLSKTLDRTKKEIVSALKSKAGTAEILQEVQRKADTSALKNALALIQSKVNNTDYKTASARTLQALSTLSSKVESFKAEFKADVERISNRLATKGKTAPTKDVPTTLESSSRQEVRMLVMEEFKREGISDKITRDEALVQAEGCASRALSTLSKAVDNTKLRLNHLNDRLDKSSVSPSNSRRVCLFRN